MSNLLTAFSKYTWVWFGCGVAFSIVMVDVLNSCVLNMQNPSAKTTDLRCRLDSCLLVLLISFDFQMNNEAIERNNIEMLIYTNIQYSGEMTMKLHVKYFI